MMPPPVAIAQTQSGAMLEEVIVSARRRSESLQETPVAVTALGAEALDVRNIQSVADINQFVPNLQFDSTASESGGGGAPQIYIRGIGQTDYTITVEPGVGLYLDGVYIGKSVGSLLDAVDLDRIEVLRGPQGTLFGKNTIGGAILLSSTRPGPEKEFSIDVTTGRYDRLDVKASANLPVNDRFRLRASAASLSRDGHVKRVLTGGEQGNKDALTGRLSGELDITDTLQMSFALDGTRSREQSPGQIMVSVDENAFFASLHNSIAFPACAPTPGNAARFDNAACANSQYVRDIDDLENTNTGPNQSDTDVWGAHLTFDWELGGADLKSITAYREASADVLQELTGIPAYLNTIGQDIDLEQFSQEFQFSGSAMDDRLDFLLGLFYMSEKGHQDFPVMLEPVQFTSGGAIDNDSSAVFGQLGYQLSDTLSLTLGARYSREKRRFLPQQQIDNVPALYEPFWAGFAETTGGGFLVQENLPLFPEVEVSRSDNQFTPSVTLDYQFAEGSLLYLSYSKGFKGGGFTMRGFPPVIPGVTTPETDPALLIPSFGPEEAEVYEAGFKAEFFQRRLRLNVAMFHTDYQDVQLTANAGPSAFVPVLINAGDARIRGLEVETEIVVADWFHINAGAGYLNSEYESLSQAAIDAGTSIDNELPNSPEWTATVGFTADIFNDDKGHLYLRGDLSFKDSHYKTVANEEFLNQESYSLLNAALSYTLPGDRWRITAGATNLTDEVYIVSGVANDGIGYGQAVVSRPREWFLGLKYTY
ncbi:TonB-dependent receptor [Kineobactrum salinum]|uniref:TonB-dependent receptor n=1 Tax=Kineobactrum salinum TaxID=2708301 RepID=A0A6C0U580_9GAMM|nr:TonB-dependent receptor [Kineobactrum salinum]QIB67320.1 TonB-dependent receptor [Kineobactrum salinum]